MYLPVVELIVSNALLKLKVPESMLLRPFAISYLNPELSITYKSAYYMLVIMLTKLRIFTFTSISF